MSTLIAEKECSHELNRSDRLFFYMLFFLNSNRILPDSKLYLKELVENKFKTASNLDAVLFIKG